MERLSVRRMIEKPHSFFTACNVTTQIVAQVASNQYGGQSFTLAHLAPFVDISRKKIRKKLVIEERQECGEIAWMRRSSTGLRRSV